MWSLLSIHAAEVVVVIDESNAYQSIDGFGASLTDSSAWLLQNGLTDQEVAGMQVLIMKLASGVLTQNFTPEEAELIQKMRENKETILRILYDELKMVHSANDRGREKLDNLIRMVEKICR